MAMLSALLISAALAAGAAEAADPPGLCDVLTDARSKLAAERQLLAALTDNAFNAQQRTIRLSGDRRLDGDGRSTAAQAAMETGQALRDLQALSDAQAAEKVSLDLAVSYQCAAP